MGLVRTKQPSPLVLPGLKVETYGTATAMPFAISRDRKTLYGAALGSGTTLYQSVDDGTTWTSVHVFPEAVVGIQELDDGEALVITNASTFNGKVYRSTGWSTSHTTATWALTLTTVAGYIRPMWAGGHPWAFGNDKIRANTSRVGIVNEYGGQTTASGDQTTKARRAYLTTDYGATWTQVLDIYTRYNLATMHTHSSAYDPYWDRLWVLHGDTSAADGTNNAQILYSDDRGTTWTPLALPVEYQGTTGFQMTSIAVLEHCLIFGGDNTPGYIRLPRKGFRVAGDLHVLANITGGTGSQMIAFGMHQNRNQSGAPLLSSNVSVSADTVSPVFVSLDNGRTQTRLWEDPLLRNSGKGVLGVVGPTYNGKVLLWTSQSGGSEGSGTHWQARCELVVPEPGLIDAVATFTGDATTTVFNYAHGLGVKPTRLMAWPEKPAGTYTVTADATNIIVTFTAAPANAAAIQFAYRYAA